MFDKLIGLSLQFRFLVLSVAAGLIVIGATQMRKMPVDVFPEFAPPVVEVQTEAIGLSAEEVESMITYSLEELLSGVPWLETTRSRSVTGLSSVLLVFKHGTDIMKARQMVQERLALAYTLPNVATPPVILQPTSATSRFMMVGISSDKIDPTELSLLARWTIKPKLVGVPGVSNVSIWGQRLRQLHVHFNPDRLRDARVVQDDIIAAAGDALWVSPLTYLKSSSPGSGGWIDNSNQRLGVEHAMPIETPEDMAKIAVTSPHLLLSGRSMALGDITETTFSHAPMIGDAIVGKGANGLMLVIEKFPGANTLEVTRDVEQALAELRRGLPGVTVEANIFRLADYVDASLRNLSISLLLGGLLLAVTAAAFISGWRHAVVGLVAIPVALFSAIVVLKLAHATLNTMILAGLMVALSVVIDAGVTDVAALREALRQRHVSGRSRLATLFEATRLTQRRAAYATCIMVLAVVPIFFMEGVAGAFFEPLALSYVVAVVCAMLIALSLTPIMALLLMKDDADTPLSPAMRLAERHRWHERLDRLMIRSLGAPRAVLGSAAALIVVAAVAWPFLNKSVLPPLQEGQVMINVNTAPGTSHAETLRITTRLSKELESLPGVQGSGAHIGRSVTGDQVVGINTAQIWVNLKKEADHDETLARIRDTVDGYPGLDHNLQSYLRDKVGEVLTGQTRPVAVRVYGPQRAVLKDKAEEVRRAMSGVPGIVDLGIEGQIEEPQIQVKVNLEAAAAANVKPGDVRRSAASIFSGLVVGYLFKDQKIFEVVVWGAPESRRSLDDLRNLWVEKADRTAVRLGDIAEVSIKPTPTMLKHEDRAPYMDVVANVSGRSVSAVIRDVEKSVAKVNFPLEYHPEVLSEYKQYAQSARKLAGMAIAALAGSYLLLQAMFRNWKLATLALASIMLALAGSVCAAALGGGAVSVGALIGFLAVLGVSARQNIALIDDMQGRDQQARQRAHQHAEGPGHSRLEHARQAALARAPIILISLLGSVLALLPIMLAGRVPGLEVVRPMAFVIVGGMLTSFVVTLFVVPAAYLLVEKTAPRDIDLTESGPEHSPVLGSAASA